MVNHVYTLLLNTDGRGFAVAAGEEYTPPEYRAVALPAGLRRVRAALFGVDPDRPALLLRARQLLALLHATPLDEFATAADPRLTYLPLGDVRAAFAGVVIDDPAAAAARLAVVGEPALLDLFGVAPPEPRRTWRALWASERPLAYRLGAAALALADRTDAVRAGGPDRAG